MKMIERGSKWALVSGGSRGIGRAIAEELAGLGYNLILVANNVDELSESCRELRLMHADLSVESIAMDLACEGAGRELFRRSEEIASVDVLVNNAGVFSFLDLVNTPVERVERVILLHDMTVAVSCRLFAEAMVRRGVRGYILNLSSFSLWMPFPGLALYGGSKAFVRTFSIALAKELKESGVTVTAVCPAGVATDLYGLPRSLQRLGCRVGALITDKSCARRSLKALWRGDRCCVPDWWNRVFIPLCLLLPDWVVRIVRGKTMHLQR